jgi:dTMP kinase
VIRFISFEGGDGSGKSTQLKLLADELTRLGGAVICTREPGGTGLGKMIRRALLEAGDEKIASETELFLYLADRAQHVREVIQPALDGGKIVLCDRFTDSTVAYQGYGRGVDLGMLEELNRMASGGLVPDLTFLLDCPPEVGLSRTARRIEAQPPDEHREDRFEREEREFHERVRRGFKELARRDAKRVRLLDARRSIEELHAEIRSIVEPILSEL